MGVLRDSGSGRVSLTGGSAATPPRDQLEETVRDTAAGDFEVLGEIGRSADGTVAYLARDRASGSLVALRATPSGTTRNEYLLVVVKRLDDKVPAPPSTCPRCNAALRGWDRFCTACGFNLWSDRSAGRQRGKTELLQAVKEATQGKFEILGEMSSVMGGVVVYFARDLSTGKVEALRLQQDNDREYSIGLTGVLKRFAEPIATYRPPSAP